MQESACKAARMHNRTRCKKHQFFSEWKRDSRREWFEANGGRHCHRSNDAAMFIHCLRYQAIPWNWNVDEDVSDSSEVAHVVSRSLPARSEKILAVSAHTNEHVLFRGRCACTSAPGRYSARQFVDQRAALSAQRDSAQPARSGSVWCSSRT